jgi:hypothetical protein
MAGRNSFNSPRSERIDLTSATPRISAGSALLMTTRFLGRILGIAIGMFLAIHARSKQSQKGFGFLKEDLFALCRKKL